MLTANTWEEFIKQFMNDKYCKTHISIKNKLVYRIFAHFTWYDYACRKFEIAYKHIEGGAWEGVSKDNRYSFNYCEGDVTLCKI